MREFWKILLAWVLGLLSALLLQWLSEARDLQAMSGLLHLEVSENLTMLKLQEALARSVDERGRIRDQSGTPTRIGAGRLRLVGQSYLHTSLFDVTVNQQARLPPTILGALHTFYWGVRQTERFRVASEDRGRSEQDRAFFLKKAGETAKSVVQEAEKSSLLSRLRKRNVA
jgi:hypothetical protein